MAKNCLFACDCGTRLLMCCWSGTPRAAAAKVDITPAPGFHLWGGPATGTLDPLCARVLVLEAGTQSLAIVVVDLDRPFGPSSLRWLRQATQNQVSFLLLAATRTHSGPIIQDEYPAALRPRKLPPLRKSQRLWMGRTRILPRLAPTQMVSGC